VAPPPAVALHSLGFPAERLADLAAAAHLPLWRSETDGINGRADPLSSRVLVLLGHAWEDQLAGTWTHPYTAWIEVAALADHSILELIQRAVETSLYISFTTITANRRDLAGELLSVIGQRRTLSHDSRDNMELALHEALSNAVLHGNLQLESLSGLSVEALERFSNDLTGRITDPDFANRRIDVICNLDVDAVIIDVVDQGKGFFLKPKTEPLASGRGFDLIGVSCQSFQLLDGGRRLSMRFPV
jgi:hypothetical protein